MSTKSFQNKVYSLAETSGIQLQLKVDGTTPIQLGEGSPVAKRIRISSEAQIALPLDLRIPHVALWFGGG